MDAYGRLRHLENWEVLTVYQMSRAYYDEMTRAADVSAWLDPLETESDV